jgi:uncharacterized protein (UPF0548 family)
MTMRLADRSLTYLPAPGGMGRPDWRTESRLRAFESTARIGRGQRSWDVLSPLVMSWSVKTSSGFTVSCDDDIGQHQVAIGLRYWLAVRVGHTRVVEPVEVVEVIKEPARQGFAYATLAGHPICGTEAFILERRGDDSVWLTISSLSRPADGTWWYAYPFLLVLQRMYRRRYLRALAPTDAP